MVQRLSATGIGRISGGPRQASAAFVPQPIQGLFRLAFSEGKQNLGPQTGHWNARERNQKYRSAMGEVLANPGLGCGTSASRRREVSSTQLEPSVHSTLVGSRVSGGQSAVCARTYSYRHPERQFLQAVIRPASRSTSRSTPVQWRGLTSSSAARRRARRALMASTRRGSRYTVLPCITTSSGSRRLAT